MNAQIKIQQPMQKASHLNDDRLGRVLDKLYLAGITEIFTTMSTNPTISIEANILVQIPRSPPLNHSQYGLKEINLLCVMRNVSDRGSWFVC
jgi:hypothetical protein